MDNLFAPIQDIMEGQIDFHGQHITDILCTVLLVIFGIVSSAIGYIYQDIYLTLWTGLAGTVITALVVVPPWPMYNRNPEKWLAPAAMGNSHIGSTGIVVDGVKVS